MANQFSTNQFFNEEQMDCKSQMQSDSDTNAAPSVIVIGEMGQDLVLDIAKWTKFLAIVATVGLSLLVIVMLNGFIAMVTTGDSRHINIIRYHLHSLLLLSTEKSIQHGFSHEEQRLAIRRRTS